MNDPDYSPSYQDEYQRLWHAARAEAVRLQELLIERSKMKLFEYAVVLNEKRDKDGEVTEKAELIVPVTVTLARDEEQAQMLAARAIPAEFVDDGRVDRIVVVVRPF